MRLLLQWATLAILSATTVSGAVRPAPRSSTSQSPNELALQPCVPGFDMVSTERKINHASTPSLVIGARAGFGCDVANIGDLNGDGVPELAVGAFNNDNAGPQQVGSVSILFMNASGGVDSTKRIPDGAGGLPTDLLNQGRFGYSVAPLGDLDGDGTPDLAIGGSRFSIAESGHHVGAVWIAFMNPNGTVRATTRISENESGFNTLLHENDGFGTSLALMGRCCGDSLIQLAVGAEGDDDGVANTEQAGAIYILRLRSNGTVNSYQKISNTQGNLGQVIAGSDNFGESMASLGDLDGDGNPDLAVGALEQGSATLQSGTGSVWILFLDSQSRVARTAKICGGSADFTGPLHRLDYFGYSLAGLGDLRGDGTFELAVGAGNDDDGGLGRGAVWILSLRPDGVVQSQSKISQVSGGLDGPLRNSDFFGSGCVVLPLDAAHGRVRLAVGAEADVGVGPENGSLWILDVTIPSSPLTSTAWQAGGLPVAVVPGDQVRPSAVPDYAGGGIVAWQDSRSDAGDIYIQRTSSGGVPQWTPGGVPICTAPFGQQRPSIVPDGVGGAIVVWMDSRVDGISTAIFAQRVDVTGVPQWAANGVAVCSVTGSDHREPVAQPDGSGGAVIAWLDSRNQATSGADLFAQRISASGSLQWAAGGVLVCSAPGDQDSLGMATDCTGGAILAWNDRRSGSELDIYAQRLDGAGSSQWTADGIAVCNAINDQLRPRLASDAQGGAVICWTDRRGGAGADIYAQRIDAAGLAQWSQNGVLLSGAAADQTAPEIVANGFGGAIVAWQDGRSGTSIDVYAQAVSSAGGPLWAAGGLALCRSTGDQVRPTLATDDEGGATVAWEDLRPGTPGIYAQRISDSGAPIWATDGVAVSDAPGTHVLPAVAGNGSGGVVLFWQDTRGVVTDIYAQRMTGTGNLPVSPGSSAGSGNMIACGSGLQALPNTTSDGAGGAYVMWQDFRDVNADIYLQHLTPTGTVTSGWPAPGLVVCGIGGHQVPGGIVPDGQGGAIMTWGDGRDSTSAGYDIYAQRVNALGTLLWSPNGVRVCGAPGNQTQPTIIAAGLGDVRIAWVDGRGGSNDIYAQEVDPSANSLWAANGVAVCAAIGPQDQPTIIAGSSHTSVIAWRDGRGSDSDIYAQSLDAVGAPMWPGNGIPVCDAPGPQLQPTIIAGKTGGNHIAVWEDDRSGSADIYAQSLTAAGGLTSGWTTNGVAVCAQPGNQTQPTIVAAASGAIIAWTDGRSASSDIYAQHVLDGGAFDWPAGGQPVCTASGDQDQPQAISDGAGNAIFTWRDDRAAAASALQAETKGSGPTTLQASAVTTSSNIYSLRVLSTGFIAPGWLADGVLLCSAKGGQSSPVAASNGLGGAIAVWEDSRGGLSSLYATSISALGQPGPTSVPDIVTRSLDFSLRSPIPNPTRGGLSLAFELKSTCRVSSEVLDLMGRIVRPLGGARLLEAGKHAVQWDGRDNSGQRASAGVYFIRVQAGNAYGARRVVLLE